MLRSKRLAWQIEIDEAAKTELGNFWKYRLGDIRIIASIEVAFPQFSTHSIMSKLDWSGRNEENKIRG